MGKIKILLNNIGQIITVANGCWYDMVNTIKYSQNLRFNQTKDKLLAGIMLLTHKLEKGMSFSKKKSGWGKDKALGLCSMIEKTERRYGDDERIQLALSVLKKYLQDPSACKDAKVTNKIENIIAKYHDDIPRGGVKAICPPASDVSYEEYLDFCKSRNSIRYYSDRPISEEEIERALAVAKETPSACNRQTSRVYTFKDKDTIRKIFDLQRGDQGWCMNADTVFVITGNMSYFNSEFEAKQVYIDGGLYAMNFCMGLHAQGIGSCFKEFVRIPKLEKKFKSLCGIPAAETPIVLLIAGHYPDDNNHNTPISYRV